jgi:hypothetical protein
VANRGPFRADSSGSTPARAKLAARAREAAFSVIERRIPGFGNLSADVKQAILVRQFGLSPEDAFQVLGPLPVSPAMLAAEARLLRRMYQLSASAAISPMSPP